MHATPKAENLIATIGLGSNLGDREANLRAALRGLSAEGVRVRRVSPLVVSKPWGNPDQPDFLNAVAEIETTRLPHQLLDQLLAIERSLGRQRSAELRWGPRTLDLDLLAMADYVVRSPRLTLPHPELARRAFVLVPWAELAPDYCPPLLNSTVGQLAAALPEAERHTIHMRPGDFVWESMP